MGPTRPRRPRERNIKGAPELLCPETREFNSRLGRRDSGYRWKISSTCYPSQISQALTGKEVEIAPLSAMPQESRLAMARRSICRRHRRVRRRGKGFSPLQGPRRPRRRPDRIRHIRSRHRRAEGRFTELKELYRATAEELDAFSLAGYIDPQAPRIESRIEIRKLPTDSDYGRTERVSGAAARTKDLRHDGEKRADRRAAAAAYRGLRKDLDLMQRSPQNPPLYLRPADASGAVRTAVPDNALRRRNRRCRAILRPDRFRDRDRVIESVSESRSEELRTRLPIRSDGDQPGLQPVPEHHARADSRRPKPTRTKRTANMHTTTRNAARP